MVLQALPALCTNLFLLVCRHYSGNGTGSGRAKPVILLAVYRFFGTNLLLLGAYDAIFGADPLFWVDRFRVMTNFKINAAALLTARITNSCNCCT